MKKLILFICLFWGNNFLYAQTADIAPDLKNQGTITPNSVQAVESCTPQFVFDMVNFNPSNTYAGIFYVNNEFLISSWQTDSLIRVSNTGAFIEKFKIPIFGVRSITWDGSHYWFSNNTTTLHRFNLTTRTVVSTITVPIQTRYATYDSRGSGGFWIGNFGTAILKVDMTGSTVVTIPAATHGLTATYGLAFDSQTAGGPYLHSFNQDEANFCMLKTLRLSDNVFTNTIDIYSLVSPGTTLTGGLAGGLFFGSRNSENIIGGLIQGSPNDVMFGISTSCIGATVASPTDVSVSPTNVCSGNPVTLSATCTSGNTVTWYNQTTGGTAIGTGSPLTQNPTINTTYYASCKDGTNESSRVATNAVTVNPTATPTDVMTWNGSVSTDWNNACNWTPNGVPSATNIVVVPSAPSNQPSVSINTAVAYAVEVQTGATFTITNTGQLTVNGFKLNEGSNSAFFNKGTIQNNGKLIIGNTAASGGFIGLHNM